MRSYTTRLGRRSHLAKRLRKVLSQIQNEVQGLKGSRVWGPQGREAVFCKAACIFLVARSIFLVNEQDKDWPGSWNMEEKGIVMFMKYGTLAGGQEWLQGIDINL